MQTTLVTRVACVTGKISVTKAFCDGPLASQGSRVVGTQKLLIVDTKCVCSAYLTQSIQFVPAWVTDTVADISGTNLSLGGGIRWTRCCLRVASCTVGIDGAQQTRMLTYIA